MAALGAIASTTKEGAFLEILEDLSDLQSASATTANPKRMIDSYAIDGLTGKVTVSITMQATSTPDANGKPVLTAVEVF